MKIAVEGCAHGELERIYETLQMLEQKENVKIDLLLCCGDFQSVRNQDDLGCLAVPQKYREMGTFYKYYSGEKVAPILTIFIGGNHEASNYLQELPYGGWVAPNIWYMGYAGVISIAGVRIAGLSGIYKGRDFMKGHFEKPPYSEDTKRSVYHIRSLDVFRLKQSVMAVHEQARHVLTYLITLCCLWGAGRAIDCFKCVSVAGSNPPCDDPFHNNYSTALLESPCMGGRKGRNGLFPATACIKLNGIYDETGIRLTVRGCALDSGTLTTDTEIIRMSHCGGFYFDEKYVRGCLQSCSDGDACNQSARPRPCVLWNFAALLAVLALAVS